MGGQTEMNVERWDAETASEDDRRAYYELSCRINEEMDADTPPQPYELWRKGLLAKSEIREHRRWIVRDGNEIVAGAGLTLDYSGDNRHLCDAEVDVLPSHRRRGLGRALLAAVAAEAEADERSVIGGGTVQGHDAEHFLKAMGFDQRLLDRRSRLILEDVSTELVDQWIADADVKAPGYTLLRLGEVTPDEYRERLVDVLNTMNDAPRDGLDLDDENMTLEQLADWEAQIAAKGERLTCAVAVDNATGEFAAFSTLRWHPEHPEVVWQLGTAVRAAHRGHAIGRWVKAANIRYLLDENPRARFVDTWNAGSNKWMLAINDDLGFRPYIWYTAWQASVADIKKATA